MVDYVDPKSTQQGLKNDDLYILCLEISFKSELYWDMFSKLNSGLKKNSRTCTQTITIPIVSQHVFDVTGV